MPSPGYRKRTIILLIALLLIRFWFGQTFELTGPEAFLWLKSHGNNLAESYWEAGPLVPWLIRLGTLFFGDTEMGVRWLAAVIYSSAGFVLFFLARHWFGARSAFWAVLLFTILPIYAWTLSFMTEATASLGLMSLAVLGYQGAVEKNAWWSWVLGAVVSGLALLVAGANVLWLAGLVLAFIVTPEFRSKLRSPWLYGMLVISLLFFLPVILWWTSAQVADERLRKLFNILPLTHDFSLGRGLLFIGVELITLGPIFLVLLANVLRMQSGRGHEKWGFLIWLPVPGLIWEHFLAFFQEARGELLPALYFPWIILSGSALGSIWFRRTELTEHPDKKQPFMRLAALALMLITAGESLMGLNPFYHLSDWTFSRISPGKNSVSFLMDPSPVAWRDLASEVHYLQKENGASLVITATPQAASALSFYLPNNPAVYMLSNGKDLTQFDFWQPYTDSATAGDSFILVTQDDPPDDLKKHFAAVVPATDEPLPDSVAGWHFFKCVSFIQNTDGASNGPPRNSDSEPLPK